MRKRRTPSDDRKGGREGVGKSGSDASGGGRVEGTCLTSRDNESSWRSGPGTDVKKTGIRTQVL